MNVDRKYNWTSYLNPEGTRKFKRVKKTKQEPTGVPPEPEVSEDFLSLFKLKPIRSRGSTHAAHIAKALEEKEK